MQTKKHKYKHKHKNNILHKKYGGGGFLDIFTSDSSGNTSPTNLMTPPRARPVLNLGRTCVLLIAVHGEITENIKIFYYPMKINKVNAVSIGICNYLDSYLCDLMGDIILDELYSREATPYNTNFDTFTNYLTDKLKENDKDAKERHSQPLKKMREDISKLDIDLVQYKTDPNPYSIFKFNFNTSYYDKIYFKYDEETSNGSKRYTFDWEITLFSDLRIDKLSRLMKTDPIRPTEKSIYLSDIFNYIASLNEYDNVIILDLTCADNKAINPRTIRNMRRNTINPLNSDINYG